MDDKKMFRMICKLILFTGIIILGVIYSKEVVDAAKQVFGMLTPFLVGAAMAFVLNLPPGTYANSLTYNRSVPPP